MPRRRRRYYKISLRLLTEGELSDDSKTDFSSGTSCSSWMEYIQSDEGTVSVGRGRIELTKVRGLTVATYKRPRR